MNFKVEETQSHLALRFRADDSANALSLAAARELAGLTKKFKKWDRPVVVTSDHPRVFCSGGNLTDYKKLKTKASGLKVNREITKCLNDFAAWPAVKLAMINGDVLGGGMEWLARFDFRWSTPGAVFAFWQRRIGLSTGWGGGTVWAWKIGEERLRQQLLKAHPISAYEAMKLGLVDRILTEWRIQPELTQACRDWSTSAVSRIRNWSAKDETRIFEKLWLAPDHARILESWRR